ncbi:hypothetical protein Tco_1192602 [Tanacetum coccineum]
MKTVSYHKLYDILKQHQNEVNEIRAERLARTANPLALVAQQQPVYHPQNTQYSSIRSQQSTRNRGKAIVTSSAPTYDPKPATVTEDDEMSKDKEIDKLMALISLSFKKIYKPTNNNLRTSSNTSRANQDNSPRINRGTGYDNQRGVNVAGARENVGTQKIMNAHETEQVNAHDVYGFLMLKDSSTCIKAFTIFVNVPEILMQQFWYTITKIKGSESYEFLLADKRITSTKYTNSFVDYIASTLGTLAAVLLSTIENVDYPSLIWEDIAYQIDIEGGKSQDVKICHILDSQRLSLITSSPSTNLSRSSSFEHFHINQGDSCCGVDSNLSEWVRMFSTYGLAIPATMLNKEIIQSESYKRFILYSTGQIPLKKSRGKGSQGKKSADPTEESVDVSDESEPEPLIRRKTSSRRVAKKKATISVDDNIVPEPDIALELGKSISLTEAEEEAAARQVHATHARIVSESIPEPARRRQSDITISKTTQKLKGIQTLIPAEQEAADVMKALKDNRRMLGRKLGTGGSDEGTGEIPGVLDESIFADAEDDNEETDLDTNAFLLVQELTVRKNAWTLKMKDAEEIFEQPPVLQQTTPIPTTITTPPINTEALAITTAIPEITPFIALQLRVMKLEQDMSEVKKFDHSADVLASIQSQVPPVVDKYLGTKLDDALLKTLERHTADLVEKYSRIIFHALMEALIEDENAMDKEVADTVKDHKRKHDGDNDDDDDDDEGPLAGSKQGHCLQTRRKTNNIICSVSDTTTWFRPIPEEEERPASPEPGMGIPQLTLHEADKKLAHSIRWYCRRIEKKSSSKSPSLKVQHSEVKAIVAHRWTPGQVTIQPNSLYKQKIGVSYMRQERNKKLYQISKLKAALYPDFRLEELVLVIWIKSEQVSPRSDAVISNMQNQCYQYKTYERYGYNYLREIVLRRADYNEYKISENDFKILHPNDFEDLNILHIQGTKFDLLPKQGQVIYRDRDDNRKMMRIDELIKAWRSENGLRRQKNGVKTYIEGFERRLKIRRIFRSLESFVGGCLRDIDYRLISKTE